MENEIIYTRIFYRIYPPLVKPEITRPTEKTKGARRAYGR